jgi:hypothetical protein
VLDGCFVVIAPDGLPTLVAFKPQVEATQSRGRVGLKDIQSGHRVFQGDLIGVTGAPAPDPQQFIRDRFVAPPPEGCPERLFVSNSGFGAR